MRDGVRYPCPRIGIWRGMLKTTPNGLTWEADACEHHGRRLDGRFRIPNNKAVVAGARLH